MSNTDQGRRLKVSNSVSACFPPSAAKFLGVQGCKALQLPLCAVRSDCFFEEGVFLKIATRSSWSI